MKNFKMAEILPIAHLEDTKDNYYHMCLAHIVFQSEIYKTFYKRMSSEGKFVLIDNGVAENNQLDNSELLKIYKEINPTEIVLPDTICNCVDTLRKTLSFVYEYRKLPYSFMGVPQGKNINEWLSCAKVMLLESRINTLGISKFLNIETDDKYVRYKVIYELMKIIKDMNRNDIEIHLLGCVESPKVINYIHECFPVVRGCDSAFVYIATKNNDRITGAMERPKGKINLLDKEGYYNKYKENARTFERLVGIEDNTKDDSW